MKKENISILIDTSAWIEFFRGASVIADTVSHLLKSGKGHICGVIYYELLQGAKDTTEAARLVRALSGLGCLEITASVWIRAGQISAGLRKKGITLPMSDVLIGAASLEYNAALLTVDEHFQKIPGLQFYND